VVDRRVRARSKGALSLVDDSDPRLAAIARGIVQHHADDAWFHQTPAFAELSWQFTAQIRDVLGRDDGLRPSFLGHILVELLLDAAIAEDQPGVLDAYYESLESVDAQLVQEVVNRVAAKSTPDLAKFIELFRQHRFLFDYAADDKLLYRLNQVMQRVRLAALPNELLNILPAMRASVRQRRRDLLDENSTQDFDQGALR
jgi:hypothetical protein